MRTVAITGADGFIGRSLCGKLEQEGVTTVRLVRDSTGPGQIRRVAELTSAADLAHVLRDATEVVHLAGRAHVLRETEQDPSAAFERANVVATMRLAHAALAVGVKRFVFVSSIGVNGNATYGKPFTESDEPVPVEMYAQSKWRAERALYDFCGSTGLELVIVRPPLVYGANARGNFERLVRLANSGLPLPIGAIQNRRSLISVDNLADFLSLCMAHPAAAGEVFLAAEPDVHSTPELISVLAKALGRPVRIFSVPVALLRTCAHAIGKGSELDKLCGSLEVSAAKAEKTLGWTPKASFAQEIAKSVTGLRERRL